MRNILLVTILLISMLITCACSRYPKNTDAVPYETSKISAHDADVSSQSEHTWKMVSREISPDEKSELSYAPQAPENIDDFFASAANAVFCEVTDIRMMAFGAQEDNNPVEPGDMRCVLTVEVLKGYADTPIKYLPDGKSIVIRYNNAINHHYKSEYDFEVGDKCFLIISEEKSEALGMSFYPKEFVDEYPYYMYYDCGAVIEKVGKKYNAYTLMELYNGRVPEYDKDKRTQKLYTKSEVEDVLSQCVSKMRNISAYDLFDEIMQRNNK